jgi:hypothetical protein
MSTEQTASFDAGDFDADVSLPRLSRPTRRLLLVSPAAGRVLDAAGEMARALRLVTAIGGSLSRPGEALVAAVDAHDADADPATERDFDAAVPVAVVGTPPWQVHEGPPPTHGTPTHSTPAELASANSQRDAARAELATARVEIARLTDSWRATDYLRDQWRARAETAEARVDGQAWAELTAEVERLHIAGHAWKRRADDATADLDAALVTIGALRDELATARRDTAADALDWASDYLLDVSGAVAMLNAWAAEVRAGKRTIPSQQPATSGEEPDHG